MWFLLTGDNSRRKMSFQRNVFLIYQKNKDAREFLAHAPTKGLWMPLGKEVKVMKCEL